MNEKEKLLKVIQYIFENENIVNIQINICNDETLDDPLYYNKSILLTKNTTDEIYKMYKICDENFEE